jgi:biopolymer transport protein ExbD
MKFVQRRERPEPETMIPLINVVFLLLIFFMIAGAIAKAPPFEWQAPDSRSESPPGRSALVVHVAADGRLALNGEPAKLDALASAVAGRADSAAPVQIKADAQVAARRVMAVMAHLRDAGVEKIRLFTRKRGGG